MTQDFPTLKPAVTDLMKNRHQQTRYLIPLNALLNRELFAVPSVDAKPTIAIERREWPVIIYHVLAASVFLQGFLRVGRVLYRQLWFPLITESAHAGVEAEAASVCNRWKHCRQALAVSGGVSAFMVITGYLASLYGWNESVAVFSQFPGLLPDNILEVLAVMFIAVAILTTALALLAQPMLRRIGFCLGAISSALAVLTLPLSLVTFPNGLSAWIRLTEPTTRQIFKADAVKD
jgi:hypothetical protein